jgi:hypothetical protein
MFRNVDLDVIIFGYYVEECRVACNNNVRALCSGM